MRGRIDRLADLQPQEAGRAAPDAGDDLPSRPERTLRGELLRRLAELPAGHPSAIADKRERSDRLGPDRPGDAAEADGEHGRPDHTGQTASRDLDGQRSPPDAGERDFWSQVRPLEEGWQAHLARWPDKHSGLKEPGPRDDLPGSWRGIGERYLSHEDNAEAEKQIELLREPEQAVTSLLKQIELENPHGAVLVGLERRLKDVERLKEKIADKMSIKGLASPADAAMEVKDAVRYTFCIGAEKYVAAHAEIGRQLESAGYRKAYGRNHWLEDADYNGVNTQWTTSDGGRFELQFHTRESFYAKEQLTHPPYRRLRQPTTTPPERVELLAFQREVCAAVPKPPGVSQISDFKVRQEDG